MDTRWQWSICALCAVLVWSLAGAAYAGAAAEPIEAGQAAQPAEAAPSEAEVERIVVTAQRRVTDLQNTGISATVLSGEDLKDKSVFGLTALQYAAPSVTISDYGSANVFNIRGIGRSQVDVDLPSGVVIYRDGAPTIAGYFQNAPYFDMGAIEVLRGPQGTFVGKSAAGGAVFIRTNSPELDEFGGMVEAGFGNYRQKEFTGVVNVPVGETFAMRLAYHQYDRADFYDRITGNYSGHPGERSVEASRIGLRWVPNENVEFTLKVDISDLDFGGNVVSSFRAPMWRVEQNGNLRYTDESIRTVLEAKYHFDNGITLSSLSGVQKLTTVNNVDTNASFPQFNLFNSRGDIDILSQEINLISPDDQRLRWVLGGFWQKQEIDIPPWQRAGFTFTGGADLSATSTDDFPWITSPWDKDEWDWAFFGHVAYDLTERLEVELGLRHSAYKTDQDTNWTWTGFLTNPMPPPNNIAPVFPFTGPAHQDLREKSLDGTFVVNFTASDDHFFYALVSRGHVTGGINIFPNAVLQFSDYDEMEVWNYEIGWKATFLDGRLRTQLNGYYEEFDNYQALFNQPGSLLPVDQTATFRNSKDDSEIWGVEFSGQALIGGLALDFGMSYLHSEIGSFKGVLNPFTGVTEDLTNAESPFVANRTGNIGAQYTLHFGDIAITPRADFAWIDDSYASLWSVQPNKLSSRNLLSLQLNVEWQEWWVRGWMTNAYDEEYAGAIQNSGTLRYAAPPREAGVRVGRTF